VLCKAPSKIFQAKNEKKQETKIKNWVKMKGGWKKERDKEKVKKMKGGQGMGKGTGLDLTHFNFQTLSAVKWSWQDFR